jgi:hypothetical protein
LLVRYLDMQIDNSFSHNAAAVFSANTSCKILLDR